MIKNITSLIIIILFLACSVQQNIQKPEYQSEDTLELVIISTSDIHGWILPWDYYRNVPEHRSSMSQAATVIDSIRKNNDHTILLDAGDWFQGNPLVEYFAIIDTISPHPYIQAIEFLNYDAIILGNHEFDFNLNILNKRISETRIPVLGANMFHHGTDTPYFKPYIIRNAGDVKIGIFGLNTPGTSVWNRARVDGIIDFRDAVETAAKIIPVLKSQGVDIIIAVAHTGLDGGSSYADDLADEENFGRRLAETVDGIDLVILGHHHRVIEDFAIEGPDGRNVNLIMSGGRGSHVGVSTFKLIPSTSDKSWVIASAKTRVIPAGDYKPHLGITDLLSDQHEQVLTHVNQTIGITGYKWSATRSRYEDTPVIDLINHVQTSITGAQLSAAAAFNTSLSFGPGDIALRHMHQLYPFENKLLLMEISGSQLKDFLEHSSRYFLTTKNGESPKINPQWPGYNFDIISGVDYVLDLRNEPGSRVTDLIYAGLPVANDDIFTIAINSYRAAGGGGFDMLQNARVIKEFDISVRDMIIEYLRVKKDINPEDVFKNNWRLLPEFDQ